MVVAGRPLPVKVPVLRRCWRILERRGGKPADRHPFRRSENSSSMSTVPPGQATLHYPMRSGDHSDIELIRPSHIPACIARRQLAIERSGKARRSARKRGNPGDTGKWRRGQDRRLQIDSWCYGNRQAGRRGNARRVGMRYAKHAMLDMVFVLAPGRRGTLLERPRRRNTALRRADFAPAGRLAGRSRDRTRGPRPQRGQQNRNHGDP
jgi:hypothetical protein